MTGSEKLPTLAPLGRDFIAFIRSRRAVILACGLVAVAAVGVLAYTAHFMRRFRGFWPEMFCYDGAANMQLIIVLPVMVACGSLFLAGLVREGEHPRYIGVTALFVVTAGWALRLVVRLVRTLSGFQFDAGCGHTPDWFSQDALLEAFTTSFGGYLVCLVILCLVVTTIGRDLRRS
jgi:hypothetical protein